MAADTNDALDRVDTLDQVTVVRPTRTALPAIRSGARLIDLSGACALRVYHLGAETLIGRSSAASIALSDCEVSRRHARIVRLEDRWQVEDLGSLNGTLVNGCPVQRTTRLRFGDSLQVGPAAFLFAAHDEVHERLLQLQKMEAVGQLAGGVAHDFNNVLSVITANVDFLTRLEQLEPGLWGECLADIRAAAVQATALTRQLLGFARPGDRAQRPLNLSQVIEDVISLCSRTFHPKIQVVCSVEPLLEIVGDQSQMHQLLLNLCLNARDALPDGGKLSIRAESRQIATGQVPLLAAGDYVVVLVSDTGVGMDAETRGRVFEPFFTTKGSRGGTGLGLATAYSVVAGHNGQIQLTSAPGEGTTFTVYLAERAGLPASVEEEATAQALDLGEAGDDGEGCILLVDDDHAVRRSTSRLLGQMGHEVLAVDSGQAALSAFERDRQRIRLVLLDLVMPGMDGEQTFHQLRRLDREVAVVLISGAADDALLERLRQAGLRGFVSKPLDADRLGRALASGGLCC